jgi:glycosyltransferase involved in cell wall biosynthesis
VRILIVNGVRHVGGAEHWIARLTPPLIERGHAIEVVHHADSPLGELAAKAGAATWSPPPPFPDLRSAFALAKRIREGKHDIVVSTAGQDLKAAGLAARLAGQPGVVARLSTGWAPGKVHVRSRWKRWRRRLYHRSFVQLAATNSAAGKKVVVGRGYLPPERVEVIYNGLDLERFDPERVTRGKLRSELGIPASAELVVSISRYAPRHGRAYEVDAALQLCAARPSLHVVFIGPCDRADRAFKEMLEAKSRNTPGGERITFLGPRHDVPTILADADVLLRATVSEGLPNIALEAMAMRVPVVATGISGTPEAVLDGETGRLVPPHDARAIVLALRELLDAPTSVRRAIGRRGRAHVISRFTLDGMVDRYEALFRRALAER